MDIPLRVLIIEDSDSDVALEVWALKAAGYVVTYAVAETAVEMKAALNKQAFDIVLSDHGLPQFDAPGALAVLKESGLDIPFIIVSGSIGEETAVALMKAGAHDYVMKDRLFRLVPAVQKELREAESRREGKRAEETLKESEAKYRRLFESASLGIFQSTPEGKAITVNPAFARMFGYDSPEDAVRSLENVAIDLFVDPNRRTEIIRLMAEQPDLRRFENLYRRKDGSSFIGSLNTMPIRDSDSRLVRIEGIIEDITDRKRAAAEELESEKRYRQLFDASPDGLVVIGLDGRITRANIAQGRMYRYDSPNDLIGVHATQLVAMSSRDYSAQILRRRLKGEHIPTAEYELVRKDGTIFYGETSATTLWTADGTVSGYLCVTRDTTERKRAEESMKESEAKYRSLFENSLLGISVATPDGHLIEVNMAYARMYGYDNPGQMIAEMTGTVSQLYANPEDQKEVLRILAEKGSMEPREVKVVRRDGTRFFVLVSAQEIRDTSGKVLFNRANHIDITDRKRAEASQLLQTAALESTVNGVVITDTSGTIAWVNTAFTKMTGYSFSEVMGENPKILKSGIHDEAFYKDLWEKIAAGDVWKGEVTNKRKDGTLYTEEMSITPVHNDFGTVTHFVAIKQDITERKQTEESLKNSEERYRQFFEDDLTGDYISTPEGKLLSCNPSFRRMFGYSSIEEALAFDIWSTYPDVESRDKFLQQLTREKRLEYHETEYRRKDGTPLYCIENAIGIFDDEGKLVQIRGYLFDDTKRRNLENQLLQAQKMESLGTLAGGIAHDFNNILGIIMGHAHLLSVLPADAATRKKYTDIITQASLRGAGLVRQMLTFARKTDVHFDKVLLNELVHEIAKLLDETFPKTVTISLSLYNNLPAIFGDATQVHQVLLNLCVNARDAMAGKGEIAICTGLSDGETIRRKFSNVKYQKYVVLSLSDTGTGMDDVTLRRIFEPFYTTKELGKGTGLGLSVVYGIVESHHGVIDVESTVGKGTTFRVYFPLTDQLPVLERAADAPANEAPGGDETILLIEDEEALRTLAKFALEKKGYHVLLASDGDEAVAIYRTRKEEIHLVVSDMGLPKMGGYDVYHLLKGINPSLRMILVSGFLEPELKSQILTAGVKDFVQKPYDTDRLLNSVRTVLDLK